MFRACSIRISRGRLHSRHHPSVRFPADAAPIRSPPTSPSVRHRAHFGHEMIHVASVIFGVGTFVTAAISGLADIVGRPFDGLSGRFRAPSTAAPFPTIPR